MDLVPDHCSEANRNKESRNLFSSRVSCLQFVKNATPMKQNKVKRDKRRYAYI